MLILAVPAVAGAAEYNLDTLVKKDSKSAVCLYEDTTNTFIFRHNEEKKMYPASTTKIMTSVVTIETVKDLNQKIKIGKEIDWTPAGSSVAWLQAGEVLSYNQLLYALMLPSGNDAATVLAVNVGKIIDPDAGSIRGYYNAFVARMNETALKAGMTDTHYVNPHGFHDPNHYTNAASLARLAAYADDYPVYKKVVSTTKFKAKTNKATHVWKNHNALINKKGKYFYKLAKGDKTGFTDAAGKCVVVSSENEQGQKFYSVIMNSPTYKTEWTTVRTLLKYANEKTGEIDLKNSGRNLFWYIVKNSEGNYALMRVTTKEDINLFADTKYTEDDFSMEFRPDSEKFSPKEDERMLQYTDSQKTGENDTVGEVVVKVDGRDYKEVDAYSKGGIKFRTTADIVVILIILLALLTAFVAVLIEAARALSRKRRKKKEEKAAQEAAAEEFTEMSEPAPAADEPLHEETEEVSETADEKADEAVEEPAEETVEETSAAEESAEEDEADEQDACPEESEPEEEKTETEEDVQPEMNIEEKAELEYSVDEEYGILTIGRKKKG